jgi:hypothetical protein
VIESPGFPDKYPHNLECSYIIITPPHMDVTLTFLTFDLENDPLLSGEGDCKYDWLDVWDGLPQGECLPDTYTYACVHTHTHTLSYTHTHCMRHMHVFEHKHTHTHTHRLQYRNGAFPAAFVSITIQELAPSCISHPTPPRTRLFP